MKINHYILLCLLMLFCFSDACAEEIAISVESAVSVAEGRANTEFRIHNTGNHAALKVTLTASFLEQKLETPVADRIEPGKSETASVHFNLPPDIKGIFPVLAVVRYQNSEKTPHSSPVVATVRTGTEEAYASDVALMLNRKEEQGKHIIFADAADNVSGVSNVSFYLHISDNFTVTPGRQTVVFDNRRAAAQFTVQKTPELPDGRYSAFLIAEYEHNNIRKFVQSSFIIPVKTAAHKEIPSELAFNRYIRTAFVFILTAAAGVFYFLRRRRQRLHSAESSDQKTAIDWTALAADIIALLIIEWFILSHVSPRYLITQTITSGGDTGSHYYTVQYLMDELLPKGKISGWTPGNYAGFPLLQFYFPLPFLIMCGLSPFITLQVAFKWVTLLGTFLLPISVYVMLRMMRSSFPGPIIGAALTLPFLFNGANSMWGGNILSTLAGEFTYSLSLALSLIFLGSLYRGCLENRSVILNAFLVFLVGFSHGYTLLFAEAMSLFFLLTPHHFIRRAWYLFRMYALAFCMLAFWLVPLILYTRYTTAYHIAWVINSVKEVFPIILIPVLIIAGATLIGCSIRAGVRIRKDESADFTAPAYLLFGIIISVVMFAAAPKLGVVDIRYVPCGQLIAGVMAGYGVGRLGSVLNRWRIAWILVPIFLAAVVIWTKPRVGPVPDWTKWNYEGFEAKASWPLFQNINTALKGTFQDPRVVYEHASIHNSFGTVRAFESLPLFAGRATLEGLYMQASLSAPFVFYIQSEISKEKSCPFKQYLYTDVNYERARRHLELFNVRDIIAVSREVKDTLRKHPDYRLHWQSGQYEIWQLENSRKGYVTPLVHEPVLFDSPNWKVDSFDWFIRDNLADVHFVFDKKLSSKELRRFKVRADSFDNIEKIPIDIEACQIKETISDEEILIETNWIGKPLLVKVSYHPNWHVEGADRIYLVSPSFMLIYPQQETVRLYYGDGPANYLGKFMTGIALAILLFNIPIPRKAGQTGWTIIQTRLNLPKSVDDVVKWNPNISTRRRILAVSVLATSIIIGGLSYHVYTSDPSRWFNKAVSLRDKKQFEQARQMFVKISKTASRVSDIAVDSLYHFAICHYLEGNNAEAIEAFQKLIKDYPYGLRCAEAYYHIGLCQLRIGKRSDGVSTMNFVVDNYAATPWAGYAKDRLREHEAAETVKPDLVKKGSSDLALLAEDNIGLYMGEGIRFFNADDHANAKPIFEAIEKNFPKYDGAAQALACLALIAFKNNDCEGTIRRYQELIDRYPQSPLIAESWYHIGLCHEKAGNADKAKQAFQTAAEKYPDTVFGRQSAEILKRY